MLVTSLKCFQCDSRAQQNCTAKLPHSALVECNYQYFANVGLEHLVGSASSFVCITAHATKGNCVELYCHAALYKHGFLSWAGRDGFQKLRS
jgi:hypothetical protein